MFGPNENQIRAFNKLSNAIEQVCNSLAFSVEIFLHRDFGTRYMGTQGAIVLCFIPFYAFLWIDSKQDLLPIFCFLGIYSLLCILVRIDCLRRFYRGERTHSRYTGWPVLMRVLPWMSELTVKRFVEPLIAATIGLSLLPWNAPLGTYLIIAATCLNLMMTQIDRYARMRVRDMNDALCEQEDLVGRFRNLRGDEYE